MVLYELQKNNRSRSSLFSVDAQSGQIMIASAPVSLGKHSLFIEASDQPVNPSERRFSLAVVTVECQTPAVQATSKYIRAHIHIVENLLILSQSFMVFQDPREFL